MGEMLVPSKSRSMPSVNRRMSSEGLAVRRSRNVMENRGTWPGRAMPRSHSLVGPCACPHSPLSFCLFFMITSAMVAFSLFLLEHARYHYITPDHPPSSMEHVDMDKFSGHILGRFAGRLRESPRHPICAAEGCFYPALVNTSPRPSFWLSDRFVIVTQLRPVGLSSYGLSARFATIPSTLSAQAHSLFTGEQAARPLLTISFRPSMGPLVGAGYRFGGFSAPHRLPPDASARATRLYAKAARLPGT